MAPSSRASICSFVLERERAFSSSSASRASRPSRSLRSSVAFAPGEAETARSRALSASLSRALAVSSFDMRALLPNPAPDLRLAVQSRSTFAALDAGTPGPLSPVPHYCRTNDSPRALPATFLEEEHGTSRRDQRIWPHWSAGSARHRGIEARGHCGGCGERPWAGRNQRASVAL